jgi:hypothetical protein
MDNQPMDGLMDMDTSVVEWTSSSDHPVLIRHVSPKYEENKKVQRTFRCSKNSSKNQGTPT